MYGQRVHILLGPGTAMHDVHTMKLGRWGPPWWGVGAVPAPPGHRCECVTRQAFQYDPRAQLSPASQPAVAVTQPLHAINL